MLVQAGGKPAAVSSIFLSNNVAGIVEAVEVIVRVDEREVFVDNNLIYYNIAECCLFI
jgi:hypothetical protein